MSDPVTEPAAQLLAAAPQTPLIAVRRLSTTEHQLLAPLLLPLQVHWVLIPLSVKPVTLPVAQLFAAEPQAPLTGVGRPSATAHHVLAPLLFPLQVHCVLNPLSVVPVGTPAAQVLADVPHLPFTAGAALSATVHHAFVPYPLPLHAQEVDEPLSDRNATIPVAQLLAATPQLPLMD